jgi:hypothetical protein
MRASGHNNDDDQRPSGEALDGAAAPSIGQENRPAAAALHGGDGA